MRKLFILLLSILPLTTFAQQKKVAVYVTGEQSGVSKVLGDQLVAALTNNSNYIAIERTASFLAELGKEQQYQRTGAVDDNELSRLGKQFGVQLVCVADISEVFGEKYVSARLIDVESAEVVGTANCHSRLSSMEELLKASTTLKSGLLGDYKEATIPKDYVDLDLPSGTLWQKQSYVGVYVYSEAERICREKGAMLPTLEQWMELISECVWENDTYGRRIRGKNGNTISLRFVGKRFANIESSSDANIAYWSSSSRGERLKYFLYCWSTPDIQFTNENNACGIISVYNRK